MNPFVSWGLLIAIVGGFYYAYNKNPKQPQGSKRAGAGDPLARAGKASTVFVSGGSGTEAAGTGEKKKKQKKKSALSNAAPKEPVPTEETVKVIDSTDDDDVAQEESQAEMMKRLHAARTGSSLSTGGKSTPVPASRQRQGGFQKTNLAAPTSTYAGSQTSSTGADADIDEEESNAVPESKSTDPSDMLEPASGGARVLNITPAVQLPRSQGGWKTKGGSSAAQSGVHSTKNQKKKDQKKLAKEAERADQKARFEQHRATMRAADAAKTKSKPQSPTPPPPSVWPKSSQDISSSTATIAPAALSSGLLDTFNASTASDTSVSQHTPMESEEDKSMARSTNLTGSYWEEVPADIAHEGEWNEVSRKSKKQKKAEKVEKVESADEGFGKEAKVEVAQKPIVQRETPKPRPAAQRMETSSSNGFQALDSPVRDTKNSSSEWDEIDKWTVDN